MIDDVPKLDLMEMGTRWQHYAELRELFACGIEVIKTMSFKSSGDDVMRVKLEGAVELIDIRINRLSDFSFLTTGNNSTLKRAVNDDVNDLYQHLRLNRLEQENAKDAPKDDRDDPTTYSTK
jgi:hypothetical protein